MFAKATFQRGDILIEEIGGEPHTVMAVVPLADGSGVKVYRDDFTAFSIVWAGER